MVQRKGREGRAVSAILKLNDAGTYAEFLGKLYADLEPKASSTTVLHSQPTRQGGALRHLSKESDEEAFTA